MSTAFQIFTFSSQQALDNAANVLSGASLTFSLTGTSTPTQAYSDAGLTTGFTSISADSAGVFAPIFLDPTVVYRVVLKTQAGAVLKTWDPANESVLNSTSFNALYILTDDHKRTAAEIAASVTPANYAYAPGHVWRYGADPTGAGDSATAISNAIKCNGFAYIPAGTYKVSSAIIVTSANVRIYGDGRGSILQTSAASFNVFEVRANDVQIDHLALLGSASDETTVQFGILTAAAFAPQRLKVYNCYFGGATNGARLNDGIKFDDSCSYGEVADCVFDQMQGAVSSGHGYGVLGGNMVGLKAHHNWFFGAAPTARGRHSVYLGVGSSYCEVTDNYSVGMNLEHFPMNALAAQSPCTYNIIARNICLGGVTATDTGAISVWGGGIGNQILNNVIISSGHKGIVINQDNIDGACTCTDNVVGENWIYTAGTTGISIEGSVRTLVRGNRVWESSQSSANTSANINLRLGEQFISGVVDCSIDGNYCSGPSFSRCALRIDPSSPVPTGTYIGLNDFRAGVSDTIELNGVSVRGVQQWAGQITAKIAVTYSASMTIDASTGNIFEITATNGTAFTINAPTNPVDGQTITIIIANNSGGALGAVTWNAKFHLSAWTQPANANYRSVTFVNDGGSGGDWKQVNASGVDIPN